MFSSGTFRDPLVVIGTKLTNLGFISLDDASPRWPDRSGQTRQGAKPARGVGSVVDPLARLDGRDEAVIDDGLPQRRDWPHQLAGPRRVAPGHGGKPQSVPVGQQVGPLVGRDPRDERGPGG